MTPRITESQYIFFQNLYCCYNENLFEGKLPDCQINLCRKKDTPGFFTSKRWIGGQHKVIHEINLNPLDLEKETIQWHANFVYYMVHLWQYEFGKPPKEAGYHNKEFVKKMEEIGFIVESIGKPGGKKTGRKISWLTELVGLFYRTYNKIPQKEPEFRPLPDLESTENARESKHETYQCPSCGNKVWGKHYKIWVCFECIEAAIPQGGKAGKQVLDEKYETELRTAKEIVLLHREEIKQQFLRRTEENQENRNNEKMGEEPEKSTKGKSKEMH